MNLLGLDLPIPAPTLALAVLVSGIAAAMQGTIGFGYAIVAVPILSLVDPRLAPVPQILTALPLTVLTAWRERGHIDRGALGRILTGRFVGLGVGAVLVTMASRRLLDALIGVSVIVGVTCLARRTGLRRTPALDLTAGTFSGMSFYVSGIGGPLLALLFRDEHGPTIRSTLGTIFAVGVAVAVALRIGLGQVTAFDAQLAAVLLVLVLLGTWASRFFHAAIEGRGLRIGILVVSAVAAIGVLLRAVWG